MEKLSMKSPDLTVRNIKQMAELFPQLVTETIGEDGKLRKAIDFELLKQELSDVLVEGDKERYQLTWPGKKEAILNANMPIDKALRPVKEDSVNWDTTENLYIEGDNLEVLKLLQESYLGKVKCIYIDPPYNTGKDFVYKDDYSQMNEEYLEESGQIDEFSNRLIENPTSLGRFHSNWITMMYARLKVARNLLRSDGIIFMSIDDSEIDNLKKIAHEIFGAHNFIAVLVWDKNRKNDAKYFSVGHEYMLVYFKNVQTMIDQDVFFRAPKEGIEEVREEFEKLKQIHNGDWALINAGLKKLYSSWDKEDERRPLARYTKVDELGPYRDDGNISWPGGGGPKYEVLHPITNKPCKVPDSGWRFPNPIRMQEEIDNGRVVFGSDEKTLPRIRRNLFQSDRQVMRSVHFSYAQTATLEFNKLFEDKRIFDNPKHFGDIKKLIEYIETEDNDLILDFFSGSATTAHAVMQLNAEDGGNRKYIMVQIPESTPETSEAHKAGYSTICEIGKERIRRAAKKIQTETGADIDYGFRVYRTDSSNMKDIYYTPDKLGQADLLDLADNIKEDRTGEDLLIQVMLEKGLPLSLPMESKAIDGCTVHYVAGNSLVACFDVDIPSSLLQRIAQGDKPLRFVCRDASFADDSARINVEETFKLFSPTTDIQVL